jgi:hypothetical protein
MFLFSFFFFFFKLAKCFVLCGELSMSMDRKGKGQSGLTLTRDKKQKLWIICVP